MTQAAKEVSSRKRKEAEKVETGIIERGQYDRKKRRDSAVDEEEESVGVVRKGVDPDTKVGGTAYMSTQREVSEGQTGSHRAKRANFGRGVRGSSPGKFQKPTWQMVQSTLFLSYICEYY